MECIGPICRLYILDLFLFSYISMHSLGRDILNIGKGKSAIRGETMSVETAVKAADVTAKTAL